MPPSIPPPREHLKHPEAFGSLVSTTDRLIPCFSWQLYQCVFCSFYISLCFLSMITDLAGLSGLWVGLVKSRPILEYVAFDHGFCDLLIKDSSKQTKAVNSGNIWVRGLPPFSSWKGTWCRRQTTALEPGRADGIPNLMSCCLHDLGQAVDPPHTISKYQKWEC